MSYSAHGDVQNEIKGLDLSDANGTLTSSQVDEFISQGDAVIDGRLSVRYVVPITGTNALKVIKQISIYLAAARVKSFLDLQTPDKEAQQSGGLDYEKTANKMLCDIQEGALRLTDATLATSANGVRSGNVDNDYQPLFDITQTQW